MKIDLSGKVAIVTGAGGGIGRAVCLALANAGAKVAVVDLSREQGLETEHQVKAAGAQAMLIEADVSQAAAVANYVGQTKRTWGRIDVFMNNAAWEGAIKPIVDYPDDLFDKVMAINVRGVFLGLKHVLPVMIEQRRGAIVATASTAAFGEPRQSVYAGAKAGVIGFVRTIAQEYGRYGIRANIVAPGLVVPEREAVGAGSLWQDRAAIMNDEQIDYVRRGTPLRRLSTADDIANSVAYLASERTSRQLTGQLITVAGGFAMR